MRIKIKRAYDAPAAQDGKRVLIDRLWPRGIKKEDAKVDAWIKDVAPSDDLRKWFGHDPGKWDQFQERYVKQLETHPDAVERLREATKSDGQKSARTVTLVYAAKDQEHNNAVVLKDFLEHH